MKEELIKLGFKDISEKFPCYILDVNDDIRLCIECDYVSIYINGEGGDLFPYNYEKVKQLIELLRLT